MKISSIKIAPWISYRNYLTNTTDSRSYISNEKTREFLLLEAEAADIFSRITLGFDVDELSCFAEQIGVGEDLGDFLIELAEAGLILLNNTQPAATAAAVQGSQVPQTPQEAESTPGDEFIKEFEKWTWENGFLSSVHWDMTYRCNEKCIHCYNRCMDIQEAQSKQDNSQKELTTAEAFSMIDEMADMGVFFLTLSGGEASLRKDFFDILGYARSKGLSVNVFSNGLNMNKDFVEKLSKYWPHRIEISLYSAAPAMHDEVTGIPGSFEKTISALEALKAANIQILTKATLVKQTVSGYEHIKKLAQDLGTAISFNLSIMADLSGGKEPLELCVSNFNELIVLAATSGSPLVTASSPKSDSAENPDRSICSAGKKSLYIDPTGNIMPCVSLAIKVGSIRKSGLKEVWTKALKEKNNSRKPTGTESTADLSSIQNIKYRDLEICGAYDYCSYCLNLCPGASYLESGNFFSAPSFTCLQARARKAASELLQEGYSRDEICLKLNVPIEFGWVKS